VDDLRDECVRAFEGVEDCAGVNAFEGVEDCEGVEEFAGVDTVGVDADALVVTAA
jgi:hypothetical protein